MVSLMLRVTLQINVIYAVVMPRMRECEMFELQKINVQTCWFFQQLCEETIFLKSPLIKIRVHVQ